MSYDDGSNRNNLGEFNNLGMPANAGDQFAAGVNKYDSVYSASLKVQNARISAGLNPYTGLRDLPVGSYSGGPSYSCGNGGPGLWWAFKWSVIFPTGLLLIVGALWFSVAAADDWWKQSHEGGFTRFAANRAFPQAELLPPLEYLSAKEVATAMSGPAMLAALKSRQGKAQVELITSAAFRRSAYACQVSAACQDALVGAEPRVRGWLLGAATAFLQDAATKGAVNAGRDACLLALKTPGSAAPANEAYVACRRALLGAMEKAKPYSVMNGMESSLWMIAARAMEWRPSGWFSSARSVIEAL